VSADAIREAWVAAGLTQRALAARSGVAQPHIARIEAGGVAPTSDTVDRLLTAARPAAMDVLRDHRDAIVAAARAARGTGRIRVFGSVARGEEKPTSDIDLLVDFTEDADLFDVVALQRVLTELLGRPVDVVSSSSRGRAVRHAERDAVPLP